MSKSTLRNDKTCLNCHYVVENRFCPNCGQENIDTRKTFYQLFLHFFEDLTHYESSFWKTIKTLLSQPAALTIEYLSGKRLSYLAPIRLYIFISLITFFSFSIFHQNEPIDIKKSKSVPEAKKEEQSIMTIQELEAKKKEYNFIEYWLYKRTISVAHKYSQKEIMEKFTESAQHNFSKVLFVYMPLFAFVLWLFHNKKRWYYFDHGIFTLHYFSFVLLVILIKLILTIISEKLLENTISTILSSVITLIEFCWIIFYFFSAHRRFYKESKTISFIKSLCIFTINSISFIVILLFYVIYTFITLH